MQLKIVMKSARRIQTIARSSYSNLQFLLALIVALLNWMKFYPILEVFSEQSSFFCLLLEYTTAILSKLLLDQVYISIKIPRI